MIRLIHPLALTATDITTLQAIQAQVDAATDYAAQVALADAKWKTKNQALFQRVRDQLETLSPGARRCGYCEDSLADEIEHIRRKSWFPGQAFQPDNYLFACGPCNSPKGNAYGVVSATGQLTEAMRGAQAAVLPPPGGQEALLHPRYDDPMAFMTLDLTNTFHFRPHQGLDAVGQARANYTIRVLRLNIKDPLPSARGEAFKDFAGRLATYYLAAKNGATATELNQQKVELLKKQHITVWREMQRQAATPLLRQLFLLVPGADQW